MKTLSLMLVLCLAAPAFAADRLPDDAPTAATVFPPGELAPGRSVPLTTGQPAPFSGQLTDPQEQVRRERIAKRDAAVNESLTKGNVILPTPAFIATVGGAVVLAIGAGIAIGVAASAKKP